MCIKIGSKIFEKVEKFKFLRMIINRKNNMTETIQDRIQAGNKAYYANQMMLKNRYINRGAKMQIYKTLIRPVATYGCESWTMKKEDENIL
jgi:DNA modification methylase